MPALWLYSENDRYWGPVKPRQWFEGYREQGGLARFVALPPVGHDGHGIFTLQPSAWHPAVEGFLRRHPKPQATVAELANHIEHARKIAGIAHVVAVHAY